MIFLYIKEVINIGIIYDLLEKSRSKENKERMKMIEKMHNKKKKNNSYIKYDYKVVINKYEDNDMEDKKNYGKK